MRELTMNEVNEIYGGYITPSDLIDFGGGVATVGAAIATVPGGQVIGAGMMAFGGGLAIGGAMDEMFSW